MKYMHPYLYLTVINIHIPSLTVLGLKWNISYVILENFFENQSILLCATAI